MRSGHSLGGARVDRLGSMLGLFVFSPTPPEGLYQSGLGYTEIRGFYKQSGLFWCVGVKLGFIGEEEFINISSYLSR